MKKCFTIKCKKSCCMLWFSWFFTCLHFIPFAFQSYTNKVDVELDLLQFSVCNRYALNSLWHLPSSECYVFEIRINHFTEKESWAAGAVFEHLFSHIASEQPSASDCLMKNWILIIFRFYTHKCIEGIWVEEKYFYRDLHESLSLLQVTVWFSINWRIEL